MAVPKGEEPDIRGVCAYGRRVVQYKSKWMTWWLTQ